MFHILVIEDDEQLAKATGEFLKEIGTVTICNNGLEGLNEALSDNYDVILLDIMLPGIDGLGILAQLRKKEVMTPVLLLTAKDQLQDKIVGYQTGADDYLTKPFFREELVLRIKAILKRTKGLKEEKVIQIGGLKLNLSTHEVHYFAEEISLNGKEFDLLAYLMKNPGQILTKDQIFDQIWGFRSETALSVVEVYMSNLRKKLRQGGFKGEIKTLRNVGYQFQGVD